MKNKETKSIVRTVIYMLFSLVPSYYLLATAVYGDTHAAATCSQTDVTNAIGLASDGDTVTVPAGTATWSGFSLTKGIHLQGAGSGVLTVTMSGTLNITKNASYCIEINGFTFLKSGGGTANHTFYVGGNWADQPLLFHHNIVTISNAGIFLYGTNGGVIHHNTFNGTWDDSGIQQKFGTSPAGSYNTADTMGMHDTDGKHNLYIEDNTFNNMCNQNMDFDDNARAVVRHNIFNNASVNSHGYDTSPVGVRHYEVYNNDFNFSDCSANSCNLGWFIWIRGGTGVIFNNTMDDIKGSNWGDKTEYKFSIRGAEDARPQGSCGSVSYPVPRQLGQGYNGTSAFTDPTYIWGNTGPTAGVAGGWTWGNPCGLTWTNFYLEGRDFFQGTAKPGYTPYTYPHPLAGGTPSDTTPPTNIATVNDGSGADIAFTLSTTQLQANWTASNDPEGFSGYKYAIGTAAGGTNVKDWTLLGNVLSVTQSGLSLTIGATYYFSVKAVNAAGLESAATNSNGQFVKGDTTPPGAPASVRDGGSTDISFTFVTTQLSANWDAAADPESGIAKYYYSIGTTAGSTNIVGWTDNGTGLSVTRTGMTLVLGTTYYFSVKAQNTIGLQGAAANSNGQVVLTVPQDSTPPTNITTVNDGTGADTDTTSALTQLSANWTAAADAQSGISGYKYAIGTSAGATDIVGWTLIGDVLTVTKTGLSLTAGTTYYFSVKAVNGVDLESVSAKSSDGICVTAQGGGSTPVITGVDVTNLTDRSATIIWDTDLNTRGQVQYGTTLNYIGGGEETAAGKRHMIDIKSLDPETRYHYKVLNIDGNGNTTESSDYTFKTYALIARPMPIVGKVYPNPYKLADASQMTFALSSATGGSVKIYTLSGKLVRNISVTSGSTDALWNLTNEGGNRINGGLYVYIMSDSDGNKKTGKIVITN